jgi:hypothetical protein
MVSRPERLEYCTARAGPVGHPRHAWSTPATGRDATPGRTGELLIRGPQVMAGYLNNPAATAETLVEDGWLRAGDILRVDEDGVFWVVDRLKELIKCKGYQVAPAELESVLLTHPDVLDAAAVGVPHAEAGEVPKPSSWWPARSSSSTRSRSPPPRRSCAGCSGTMSATLENEAVATVQNEATPTDGRVISLEDWALIQQLEISPRTGTRRQHGVRPARRAP